MCEKAVEACLLTSKFVSYWFVSPKMLKNFAYCLFFDNLVAEYDYGNSDDDSVVDLDYYSYYIKIFKLFFMRR